MRMNHQISSTKRLCLDHGPPERPFFPAGPKPIRRASDQGQQRNPVAQPLYQRRSVKRRNPSFFFVLEINRDKTMVAEIGPDR